MTTACVDWASNWIGECVATEREAWSILVGYLSISFWICAQAPQVIKNFYHGQAHSLSPVFLTIWWFGDVSNLCGSLLTKQLPFQIYLAGYFVLMDTILCLQYLYYVVYLKRGDAQPLYRRMVDGEGSGGGEDVSLLTASRPGSEPGSPRGPLKGGKGGNEVETSVKPNVAKTRHSLRTYGSMNWPAILTFFLYGANAMITEDFYVLSHTAIPKAPTEVQTNDSQAIILFVGQVFAWTSLISYLSSRMPQIYKNYRRKSTEGLAVWMFCFAVLGNAMYTLSVFLKSTEPEFVLKALPFILGSAGTLMFDFVIFAQWLHYDQKNSHDVLQ